MGMVDLTSMVSRMPQESRWWLLPIAQQHSDADEDAGAPNIFMAFRILLTCSQIWPIV